MDNESTPTKPPPLNGQRRNHQIQTGSPSYYLFAIFCDISTVLPAKSDSDVILCLQLLSKPLT